jgi:DNA repair protein RecN (Recombination protein N)
VLTYLSIRNLAIIDRLELELESGLTVITGETGAGKSMLLNGLTLLLGARSARELVRSGQSKLVVEGLWEPNSWQGPPAELLGTEDDSDEILVRRTITLTDSGKRDRLLVADRITSRSALAGVAADLVSIASQHEYVRLLKRPQHIHILDAYGSLHATVAECGARHTAFSLMEARIAGLEEARASRQDRLVQLRERIDSLTDLDVQPAEDDELLGHIDRLTHAVDITRALQSALDILYENDGDLLGGLGAVGKTLSAVSRHEPRVSPLVERIHTTRADLEDVVDELRGLAGHIEADPNYLDHLQARLAVLQKAMRRYSVDSTDELLDLLSRSRQEYSELEDLDLSLDALHKELEILGARLLETVQELHLMRVEVAGRLSTSVEEMLAELEMERACFTVAIDFSEETLTRLGGDRVEFLLSANPGQPPLPLQKVASGGELSRILLAFKVVLADADPVPTYLFDEIDAGIGGKTALAVGRLMARMAKGQQVLCVTHTAQLAAYADQHLVVRKEAGKESTSMLVSTLKSRDEKIAELARMLSGMSDSKTARSHAAELLKEARKDRLDD